MTRLACPIETAEVLSPVPVPAHVVVLTNFIPPHRVPLFRGLAKRVQRLTVLLSTPMEPNRTWPAAWGDLDVQIQRTFHFRHAVAKNEYNYVYVPWDTIGRLRALSPDVILSDQLGPRSCFSTLYAKFARKSRLLFWAGLSEHTERDRSRARTFVRKRLLRQCQGIVVNGKSGARYLERLGVDPATIFRCPWAAAAAFYEHGSAWRPRDAAHRLLYVGRLVGRKGLMLFLPVLARWAAANPQRKIEFDLAGDGPLRSEIRDYPVPPNVRIRLLGEMSYDELTSAYSNAGIFVLPTLTDDWGMVVNEALGSGLPVLGSRYSQAVEDLCIDGVSGWSFRPDTEFEMKHALDRALNTPYETLNTMREAARESVTNLTPEFGADVLQRAVAFALNGRQTEFESNRNAN